MEFVLTWLFAQHVLDKSGSQKVNNALVLLNNSQDHHDGDGLSIQEFFKFGTPNYMKNYCRLLFINSCY